MENIENSDMAGRRRRFHQINNELDCPISASVAAFIAATEVALGTHHDDDLARLYSGEVGPADIGGNPAQ